MRKSMAGIVVLFMKLGPKVMSLLARDALLTAIKYYAPEIDMLCGAAFSVLPRNYLCNAFFGCLKS